MEFISDISDLMPDEILLRVEALTDDQREVAVCLARGMSEGRIAEKMTTHVRRVRDLLADACARAGLLGNEQLKLLLIAWARLEKPTKKTNEVKR